MSRKSKTEGADMWLEKPLGSIFRLSSGTVKPKDLKDWPTSPYVYPVFGGNGIIGYSDGYNSDGEIILIGRVGEYCGITKYVNERCWITDNALFTREFIEDIDIKFLSYKLQHENLSRLRNKGGQPLVSQGPIYLHRSVMPILKIQQRAIARVLSTWDEAITKTTGLITQKEQRKKWLMQQLLTGKKRLKGFGGEWKKYSYEDLLKEVKRPIQWDDNRLYKLISVRRNSGGIFFREPLYGHQIKVKDLRTAFKGDFLFSKMQILHGASALVTQKFDGACISGSYIAVVTKDQSKLNMDFLNWYSKLPYFYHQTFIASYGVAIEKMTFEFEYFLGLNINLPSTKEQEAIAKVLETADNEIKLLETKLEQLKEQKKGLMQQLLTGRKRLKV